MKGRVKSFLPEKGYGFLSGDDGRSYFFHASDIDVSSSASNVVDGLLMDFEPSATSKGYRARKCRVTQQTAADMKYEPPSEFLTSKTSSIRGWQLLEVADWLIVTSSRESPDDARDQVSALAKSIGANGAIELRYTKSTGSEPSSRKGTHHYTIHHFSGRPVVLARPSGDGGLHKEQLVGVNKKAASAKVELAKKTELEAGSAMIPAFLVMGLCVLFAILLLVGNNEVPAAIVGIAGFGIGIIILASASDYDAWLQHSEWNKDVGQRQVE